MSGGTKFASWYVNPGGKSFGKTCSPRELHIALAEFWTRTFTLDCTDAFHQARELDDVVVEPPQEYLIESLASSWQVHKHLVEAAETIAGSTPSWSTMG